MENYWMLPSGRNLILSLIIKKHLKPAIRTPASLHPWAWGRCPLSLWCPIWCQYDTWRLRPNKEKILLQEYTRDFPQDFRFSVQGAQVPSLVGELIMHAASMFTCHNEDPVQPNKWIKKKTLKVLHNMLSLPNYPLIFLVFYRKKKSLHSLKI